MLTSVDGTKPWVQLIWPVDLLMVAGGQATMPNQNHERTKLERKQCNPKIGMVDVVEFGQ